MGSIVKGNADWIEYYRTKAIRSTTISRNTLVTFLNKLDKVILNQEILDFVLLQIEKGINKNDISILTNNNFFRQFKNGSFNIVISDNYVQINYEENKEMININVTSTNDLTKLVIENISVLGLNTEEEADKSFVKKETTIYENMKLVYGVTTIEEEDSIDKYTSFETLETFANPKDEVILLKHTFNNKNNETRTMYYKFTNPDVICYDTRRKISSTGNESVLCPKEEFDGLYLKYIKDDYRNI